MTINVRTKGQCGEREIATMLNDIIAKVRREKGLKPLRPQDYLFQRNQNQSAVGGSDLSNPMGLEIEVKRQENLAVTSWWKQCVASAERTGGLPILIYRQNRKAWRVVIPVHVPMPGQYPQAIATNAEIPVESFKVWFTHYASIWDGLR